MFVHHLRPLASRPLAPRWGARVGGTGYPGSRATLGWVLRRRLASEVFHTAATPIPIHTSHRTRGHVRPPFAPFGVAASGTPMGCSGGRNRLPRVAGDPGLGSSTPFGVGGFPHRGNADSYSHIASNARSCSSTICALWRRGLWHPDGVLGWAEPVTQGRGRPWAGFFDAVWRRRFSTPRHRRFLSTHRIKRDSTVSIIPRRLPTPRASQIPAQASAQPTLGRRARVNRTPTGCQTNRVGRLFQCPSQNTQMWRTTTGGASNTALAECLKCRRRSDRIRECVQRVRPRPRSDAVSAHEFVSGNPPRVAASGTPIGCRGETHRCILHTLQDSMTTTNLARPSAATKWHAPTAIGKRRTSNKGC